MRKRTEMINTSKIDWSLPIWQSIFTSRGKVCESCNSYLGSEPLTYMFDHLLEKNTHPEIKYEEWNIGLVCGTCHDLKTKGFPTEKHQELINKAKQRYESEALLQVDKEKC
jgi:hypothetical protein